MSENAQKFILNAGKLELVQTDNSVQIKTEAELQDEALQVLPPTSIAHLPGWTKAWQKDNDGEWQPMIGGE